MNWKDPKKRQLIKALLSLETATEAEMFLYDLMTKKEIEEFSNRLEAAKMLTQQNTYMVIAKKTHLSSTTIARVSKFLQGKGGGYKSILNKLLHRPLN